MQAVDTPGRHVLTIEEGLRGSLESVKSKKELVRLRKAALRMTKEVAKLNLEGEGMAGVMNIIRTLLLNPYMGGALAYLLVAFVYDKQHGFSPFKENPVDGDHLKGAILAAMVIPGIGQAAGSIAGAVVAGVK